MMRAFSVALLVSAMAVVLPASSRRADPNHPTGTTGLLLVDKLGGQVRLLDPVTYKERAAIKLSPNPHDFVITTDRKLAYVPIYGDGIYGRNASPGHEIAIIDLAAAKVVATIDVSPYRAPHGIQLAPDGLLYVTSDLDRKLLVVDPKSKAVKTAIDTEGTGHWVGMLPNGSKLYVTNKNDKPFVSVIDAKSRTMVGKVPTPNGTQGIAISPDGKRVVLMDYTDPVALIVDPKTDTVVDRIRLKNQTTGGYKVYFSPDSKWLLTMNSQSTTINILSTADLHGQQRTATVGKDPMGFAFSADGKRVLVANHGDGSVSVIDLQTGEAVTKFQAGTGIETLAFY
jgi:YVTN family beta-propeller protein